MQYPRYTAKSDNYNWILVRETKIGDTNPITGEPTKNPGEIKEENIGYYPTIEELIKGAANQVCRDLGSGGIDKLNADPAWDALMRLKEQSDQWVESILSRVKKP